jgi:hypothetical protein
MAGTSMLDAAIATGAGAAFDLPNTGTTTFQAYGTTSAGAGAATIVIQVSNDDDNWITAGTITLTLGTSATTDGFAFAGNWDRVRANVTAISGTNASVSVVSKDLAGI